MIRITFLGTGTSHGVPVIGCSCPVCTSSDPRDNRYRSSILIEKDGTSIVIDTGYEFRLQCLRAGIKNLDGVLYTHDHSDHLMGLDDLRVFCRDKRLPVWSIESEMKSIENRFSYALSDMPGIGLPQLDAYYAEPYVPFRVGGIEAFAIPVMHGCKMIAGFRFGSFAYITDVSDIMLDRNAEYLKNLKVLVIGALREKPHATHYSFSEAIDAAGKIGAEEVYFTHINHSASHEYIERKYAGIAKPAYDGLVLEV